MRFQEPVHKARRGLTLILTGLTICGLLMVASICLAAGDEWAEKRDMPTARRSHSTSAVKGRIYAIAGKVGTNAADECLSTVEEYNPATDIWTKKADIPTARGRLSTSVVNDKIYAIGGADLGQFFSTVEEYDPVADTWTKKADMPTARWSLSTSAVNGKIYAIGGGNAQRYFAAVEEYDPVADTWTKKADMPTARRLLYTSVVDGRIYAIGGVDWSDQVLSTVEEYDPATDTWTKKADMPTARMLPSASAVNGKIYAMGGLLLPDWTSVSVVEVYDPATDTWASKPDMPTSREAPTSVVNGRIYAIGGGPLAGPPLPTVEEYTPEGWPFAVSPQGKLTTMWGSVKRSR